MNLFLPFLAAIKYSTAAADTDQQKTTLTCFDQSGYDLSESTSTEFKDGKYKINLSWSHVPDIVKCPGPPTPCLVQFDEETVSKSGLHSVSIDFICGHPGVGFMVPHYDVHWYLISEEERALMTCEVGNYGPACNVPSDEYEQPTPEGAAFFEMDTEVVDDNGTVKEIMLNMPEGFVCGMTSAIPQQGLHCSVPADEPATPSEWIEPAFIMGSYGKRPVFVEPMGDLGFVTTDGKDWETEPVYVGQTISTLPSKLTWTTNDGVTTVTVEGKANDVGSEDEDNDVEEVEEDPVMTESTSDARATKVSALALGGLLAVVMFGK